MASRPQAFFLPSDAVNGGQRFCLYHPPPGPPESHFVKGLVLYVHPFAEEMNKSRRMAALQSRALAAAGYAVLQIDLLGCGDSSGDFGDATWDAWVHDVVQGCQTLRRMAQVPASQTAIPLWLWGLRAGCLLAVDAAAKVEGPVNLLLWQPPASGKLLLQQFLRLKVAGDMLGGQAKGVMDSMRQRLANGSAVEIAGYVVSAELAMGLERATLTAPGGSSASQRLEWFELSTRDDASLSPVASTTLEQWRQAGFSAQSHVVQGPAFWQTSEIEESAELINATIAALARMTAVPA
jgi:uncharacterized protein